MTNSQALHAQNQRDHRWGNDNNVHSPYHRNNNRRGVSTEGAIIIGLGALLIGKAIGDRNNRIRNNQQVIIQRHNRADRVIVVPQRNRRHNRRHNRCRNIVRYDYYGNPYVISRTCRHPSSP